jgi:hypothetical protein
MGLWFPCASTEPDERVTFEAAANLFQGRRTVGGKVTVTNRRLLFTPNRLDGVTGGRGLVVNQADIRKVWTAAAGGSAVRQRGIGASLRPQVGVDHARGRSFIVVRRPDQLTNALLEGLT